MVGTQLASEHATLCPDYSHATRKGVRRCRLFRAQHALYRSTHRSRCRSQRAAAKGEPWRFYDLGHGLCTYEFFDQCPHWMACAKCAFYRPKGSSHAQLLEAKANLLRLKQEIPLTDDEAAAVDDGLEALERLCLQLTYVPTPA